MPAKYYLSIKDHEVLASVDDMILDKPFPIYIDSDTPAMSLTWTRSTIADYETTTSLFTDAAVKRWVGKLRAHIHVKHSDKVVHFILLRSLTTDMPI